MPDIYVSRIRPDHPFKVLADTEAALRDASVDLSALDTQQMVAEFFELDGWHQFLDHHGNVSPAVIVLDEDVEPGLLNDRIANQAGKLSARTGIPEEEAFLMIAKLRPTAHPLGPHKLDGASASTEGQPQDRFEFRGISLTEGPVGYRDGSFVRLHEIEEWQRRAAVMDWVVDGQGDQVPGSLEIGQERAEPPVSNDDLLHKIMKLEMEVLFLAKTDLGVAEESTL